VERIVEKWSKLADNQAKLAATSSGMVHCANAAVVEGSEILGQGQSYLDVALEEAEQARSALADENTTLRHLVLTTVNQLQTVSHDVRLLQSASDEEVRYFTTSEANSFGHDGDNLAAYAIHSRGFIPAFASSCCIRNTEEHVIHPATVGLYTVHRRHLHALQPVAHVVVEGRSHR
jgi:hypothetical protein